VDVSLKLGSCLKIFEAFKPIFCLKMSIVLNNLPTSLNIGSKTFKFQAFRKAFQKLLLKFKIRRCGLLVIVAIFLILLILFVNSAKEPEDKDVKLQLPNRLYNMNLDKINKLVSIAEKDGEVGKGMALVLIN